jgi:hypothetical protein
MVVKMTMTVLIQYVLYQIKILSYVRNSLAEWVVTSRISETYEQLIAYFEETSSTSRLLTS